MALSGKQVRQLRSLAHHLNPIIHIGKADITDALVKETEAALEARELIKCAVLDGALDELACLERSLGFFDEGIGDVGLADMDDGVEVVGQATELANVLT